MPVGDSCYPQDCFLIREKNKQTEKPHNNKTTLHPPKNPNKKPPKFTDDKSSWKLYFMPVRKECNFEQSTMYDRTMKENEASTNSY